MTCKEKTFNCAYCGKVYSTKNYNKKAKNHFCSKDCSIKYRKEIKPFRGTKWTEHNCTCDYCGKKFHKVPSAIKELNFCSRKCQNTFLAHRVRDKVQNDLNCTCAFCGKKFHRKQSHVGSIQFCGIECKKAYETKIRESKEHIEVCPVCGKEFIAGIKRDIFCSLKCQIEWQRRYYKKVKCSYCGKEIEIDKTRQEQSKSGLFFCSKACIGKYYRGDKSPVYKGTSSILDILRRYYERYQKGKAFAKYEKKCQVCGKEAENIHHIYPLHKIVEDYFQEHKIDNTKINKKISSSL